MLTQLSYDLEINVEWYKSEFASLFYSSVLKSSLSVLVIPWHRLYLPHSWTSPYWHFPWSKDRELIMELHRIRSPYEKYVTILLMCIRFHDQLYCLWINSAVWYVIRIRKSMECQLWFRHISSDCVACPPWKYLIVFASFVFFSFISLELGYDFTGTLLFSPYWFLHQVQNNLSLYSQHILRMVVKDAVFPINELWYTHQILQFLLNSFICNIFPVHERST